MKDAGSGCASRLADLLDKRGLAWCRENEVYILEELHVRARQRNIPWDRVAALELVRTIIRTMELEQ